MPAPDMWLCLQHSSRSCCCCRAVKLVRSCGVFFLCDRAMNQLPGWQSVASFCRDQARFAYMGERCSTSASSTDTCLKRKNALLIMTAFLALVVGAR